VDAEEARSHFLELHQKYVELDESWSRVRNDLQAAYTEKRAELAKLMFPKKKLPQKQLSELDYERWPTYLLQRPYLDEWSRYGQEIECERRWLRHQLSRLAVEAAVHRGSRRVELDRVWLSSYSTQGWGMQKYARSAAELRVAEAAPYCEARILEDVSNSVLDGKPRLHAYIVMVLVEHELDAEIVRKKPGMGLRDWLKWCWKNGVNPRVYNPFLPHGLEEKLGITYFGDDVKEKTA
jgi:hypothetical protein